LGLENNRASITAYSRYLSLLQAGSSKELEDRVVCQVRDAMLRKRVYGPPIKLSRVALQFSINPAPIFDSTLSEGRLTYSKDQQRFLISLGAPELIAKKHPIAGQLFEQSFPGDDPSMTRKLRFTYAHELAHRFCFVERTGTWIRALDLAVERKPSAAKLNDQLRLSKNEERFCNRVAGRLLVPDELLTEHWVPLLRGEAQTLVAAFYKRVDDAAARFVVTFDCMIVQLQRAHTRHLIEFPNDFCAMLIGESSKVGNDHLASRKSRVRVAVLPISIEGFRVRPFFPGLAVDKLGDGIHKLISRINENGQTSGYVDCSLTVRTDEKKYSVLHPRLRGWWHLVGHKNKPETSRVLMWGSLGD
jgi:hypothetical protein